jgi:hypothetical protein
MAAAEWIRGGGQPIEGRPGRHGDGAQDFRAAGRGSPPYRLEDFTSMRAGGFTKLLFDEVHNWVLGGGIVVTHAGDLIGEVCFAGEMGGDPIDVGKTIASDIVRIDRDGGRAFKECAPI